MSVKILQAKNNFLDKLSIALDKEQEISSVLRPSHKQKTDETRKEILERLAQDLLNPQPASNPPKHNEPIRIEFENYMDKLVRRVKDKHKHQENIEKLEQLIETTRLELVNISTATPPKKIRPKKSIHIKFKDGAIRPTHQVSLSNLSLYHWELNSDAQSWTSIGNDPEIELGQSSGEVRLHFQHYVSNKIKISTVIKRQAAAAKRKQYRFELDDIEFQQRCTGVAGRIKRLLSPPVRNITNASFTMRVFQDRVAKLPEHLNVDLPTIVDLCDNNDVTDPDYIAMVEFIEPTIHLNPKKLHTELKDIYEGNRIVLKIDERTGTLRFKQANYTSAQIRNAADGYTQSNKGLNTDAIREILTANGIDNQGKRQDLEKKLTELLGEEKKKPEKQPLFMLDEASTKEEEGETKRQVVRRSRARKKEERLRRKQESLEQKQREEEIMHALEQEEKLRQEEAEIARKKQEDDDRIERERQQQEVEAEEAAEKLRQEQAEIARKKQEDDDRIERERQQQEVEAEKAAEKLRKEQAEITRKKQEDDDRIERERQQQEVEAEKAADKLRQEQEEIERKQIEDNERIQQERDVISRQRETVDELQTNITIMSEYEKVTGKGSGQELSGGNEWFIVNGKNGNQSVYKTTKTNKSAPKKSTMEKANAAGWYSKDFMTGRELKLQEEKEKLRKKEVEIAQKAKEEQERIESKRLQQVVDAEAAAEKLRLEQEGIALKAQEDNERIERLQQVAEAAAEKLRLEQEGIALKAKEEDDRIKREAVEQLSQSDRNYIKYVFDWYDKEPKDGCIELNELKDALSAAGYDASTAEQMLNEYDKNGNGNIDYDEFEVWCAVTNAVEAWKKSNAAFNQTNSSEEEESSEEEVKRDEEEDKLSTMTVSDLKKYAANLNTKKKKTVQGYSDFRKGDQKELADLIRTAESKMAIVPPGELSEMLNNMTDDWASSDEELNFALDSENEDMEFAASSSIDTDDSDMDFAESSDKKTSSGLDFAVSSSIETDSDLASSEFAESAHTSSGLEFAASSAVDSDKSEDFAVSSSVETDSDLDFAESSGKTSSGSGLEFAESSAVESD